MEIINRFATESYVNNNIDELVAGIEEALNGIYGADINKSSIPTIRQIAHDEVIQNRTHGIDVIKGEVFIENVTFPLTDGAYEGAAALDIVAGDTLVIVYNGTEYTCKLQDASGLVGAPGALATGNLDLATEVGDNGMPFVMAYIPSADGSGVVIMDLYNPEATSCTVSTYKATEVVNKLPNKFIDAEWMATEITTKGDEVLEEITITGQLNQEISIYTGYLTNSIRDRLQLGEQYVVTVNGVEYVCEYKSTNTPDMLPEEQEYYLGNYEGIPIAFSSGEPFVLASGTFFAWKQSLGDTVTISVHEAVKAPNKLPAKFLPDDIGGNVDLTGYAKTEDIPTKTSELTNDSGFITAADIPEVEVPTKTSELTNDSGFITAAAIPDTSAFMSATNPVGTGSFSMNRKANTTVGAYSSTFGNGCTASGAYSHAEGCRATASGNYSHAEGQNTIASEYNSHAEGVSTAARGPGSHAEGSRTAADGYAAHAEGSPVSLTCSLTGEANTTTYAHSAASDSILVGSRIRYNDIKATVVAVDGVNRTITLDKTLSATALTSTNVTIDVGSVASGDCAHSEGYSTVASGEASHAEGYYTIASGTDSHAEGYRTIASGANQHVQGKYNIEDTQGKYAHIVGNGKYSNRKSNAHTLDWDGNAWFAGDVYVGSTSGTNRDGGSKKLATEDFVQDVNNLPMDDIFNAILTRLPRAEEAEF